MKIIFSLIEFFNVKVSLFFDFFNPLVHIFWVLFGEWRYSVCVSLLFLDLSTGWKFVVSLTSPSLYPGGGCPRSLLGTRMDWKLWRTETWNRDTSIVHPAT